MWTKKIKEDEEQNENALDPGAPGLRNRWNANQVDIHENLFPFRDNLITLMFTVASDLSEAQRERLTSSFSLKWINITACIFEAVKTTFLELFCTPFTPRERTRQQHEQNLHCGRLRWSRLWTMSQRWSDWWARRRWWWMIMFLDMVRHWVCLAVQTIEGPPSEKKKRKWKRKAQKKIQKKRKSLFQRWTSTRFWYVVRRGFCVVDQRTQRQGRLVKRQWWFSEGWFSPFTSQMKAQAKIFSRSKAWENTKKKRKGEEEAHPQSGLSISEAHEEEGCSHAWESDDRSSSQWPDDSWNPAAGWYSTKSHTDWMAVPSLNLAYHPTHVVLDFGCTVGWIEIGCGKIPEAFLVLWYNDRTLPLQQILCVRKLRNKNLFGKLHYSLSNNTTMFIHGWCAWDKWCTFRFLKWEIWVRLLNWILEETSLHAQLLVRFLLQLSIPQWDILCWTWRVLRIRLRLNRVIDLVTQRDM